MRLKHDPIEKTEEFKEAMKDIEVLSFFRFFFTEGIRAFAIANGLLKRKC